MAVDLPIALRIFREALKNLSRPERLNSWQWAEKNRKLPKSVTAKPGRYRTSTAPFQKAPQESFEDPEVQITVLMWAKRLGKTEMTVNVVGATIDANPRNILIGYPTDVSGRNFSKKFFNPLVHTTDCLRGKIVETRKKNANNTLLSKDFPGGNISIVTAGSENAFRMVQAPIVICDEIDGMEDTVNGDPVLRALGRAENYSDCIQILSSTPTRRGVSRIESWFLRSDQCHWHCPCPKCSKPQVLKWEQVNFKGKPLEETTYTCEFCKADLTDQDRLTMVKAGFWKETAPFKGIRGYWLNGLNSTFPPKKGFKSKLHQFAQEFLDACSEGEKGLIVWTNEFKAETWEVKGEAIEAKPLFDRCELYLQDGKLPAGVLCITAYCDVQEDRLETTLFGWGIGEEAWALQHHVIMGDPDKAEVWSDLEKWWDQSFEHPSGSKLRVACGLVDMGFKPRSVIKFTRYRQGRRIYAAMGARQAWQPLVSRPKKSTIKRADVFTIGTDTAKEVIFSRLKIEKAGPRFFHFPIGQGFDEEYFKQLASEKLVTEYDDHNIPTEKHYVKIRTRNEALDIICGALAALDVLNPNWIHLAKSLQVATETPKETTNATDEPIAATINEPPANPRRPQQKIQQGGFVGRWRRGF